MPSFTTVVNRYGVLDSFQYLAGGDAYNQHLAGSDMYYAPTAANLSDTTGAMEHITKDAYMFNQGADALEKIFDLLPYPVETVTRTIRLISYVAEGDTVTITGNQFVSVDADREGNDRLSGMEFNGTSFSSMDFNLTTEESIASNLAAGFAAYAMPNVPSLFPSIVGVVAYDLATGKSINTGALGKMTIDTVAGTFSSLATKGIASALGITSPAGVLGLSVAVGMVVGELTEMAMKLDNSFGFGGEMLGTIDGEMAYKDSLTLAEGLRSIVGIEKPAGTLHDWDGEIIGAYINSTDEDGNNLTTTISSRTINSKINTNIAPTTEETMDYGFDGGNDSGGLGGGVSGNDSSDGASTEAGNSAGGMGTNAGGTGGLQR